MRTIPSDSFARLSRLQALWRAYQSCRQGKRRQPRMAAFDLDADRHLCALHRALVANRYQPEPWRLRVIHDPKTRLIAAPSIRDRIVHRALLDEIGPHYERSFIEHSYTGAVGRGPHRAVLQYLQWLRHYDYRLGLDIRRYFPSIHHPTLCRLLFRKLHDPRTQALIQLLLTAGGAVYRTPLAVQVMDLGQYPVADGCGLALGSYLSQWCGTFYLDGLDHFVKRELKIRGYLRYMDDFVLFSDDRAQLCKLVQLLLPGSPSHDGCSCIPNAGMSCPTRIRVSSWATASVAPGSHRAVSCAVPCNGGYALQPPGGTRRWCGACNRTAVVILT